MQDKDSDLGVHQKILFRVHFLVTINQFVNCIRLTADRSSNQSNIDPCVDLSCLQKVHLNCQLVNVSVGGMLSKFEESYISVLMV